MTRADPFEGAELDVSGFKPTAKTTPPRPEVIRQVSEAQNFPRRHQLGRCGADAPAATCRSTSKPPERR
jgi:hypothetical protein